MKDALALALLRSVRRRLTAVALLRRAAGFGLVVVALYGLAFVAARGLGLFPEWDHRLALALPCIVLGLAWSTTPRVTDARAAHAVDAALHADDLFLARTSLRDDAGAFASLVIRRAEERAARASAASIVPMPSLRPIGSLAAGCAAVALLVAVLPAGDPFGSAAGREHRQQQEVRLAELERATEERLEALAAAALEEPTSPEVAKALEELQRAFGEMKPEAQEQNRAALEQQREALGREWRAAREQSIGDAAGSVPMQSFGDAEKRRRWQTSLASGSTNELDRELRALADELDAAGAADDPAERRRHLENAQRNLRELAQFAQQKVGSPEFAQALARALEQLQQIDRGGGGASEPGSAEREALLKSLKLAGLELDVLEQRLNDMKSLEEALSACEAALAANAKEGLDATECKGCQSLSDYESFYRRIASSGEPGPGQSGAGHGKGVAAAEDDSQKTDFQPEKSPSELTAGKLLLEIGSRGAGDLGERRAEFAAQVEVLRQRASEAIQQEEVPPGYHGAIRRYFDSLQQRDGR